MVALLKVIATLSAAFFAGGGLFISMVLYPAIMTDMASAVAQFGKHLQARGTLAGFECDHLPARGNDCVRDDR